MVWTVGISTTITLDFPGGDTHSGRGKGESIWNLEIWKFWIWKWSEGILDRKCKEFTPNDKRCWVALYGFKNGNIRRDDRGVYERQCTLSRDSRAAIHSPIYHRCTMTMRSSLQPFTATRSVYGARWQWCVWTGEAIIMQSTFHRQK